MVSSSGATAALEGEEEESSNRIGCSSAGWNDVIGGVVVEEEESAMIGEKSAFSGVGNACLSRDLSVLLLLAAVST